MHLVVCTIGTDIIRSVMRKQRLVLCGVPQYVDVSGKRTRFLVTCCCYNASRNYLYCLSLLEYAYCSWHSVQPHSLPTVSGLPFASVEGISKHGC